MDLLEYLRLVRRRWKLLAACVLVAGAAAFITTPAQPDEDQRTYRATHQLLRDASAPAPAALATVSLYVQTGEVPVRVAERIDYQRNPALLARAVTLEIDEQVGVLDITVTGSSRAEAAERANAFAEEVLAFLGEQATSTQQDAIARVNEQLTTLQAEIDQLDDEIAAAAEGDTSFTLEAERDSKVRQYGAALDQQQQVLNQPPPSAGYVTLQAALPELARVEGGGFGAPGSRPVRTAIAVIVGFALGLGVVLLAERLDTRVHDVATTAGAFGLPVVAEVPFVETGKRPTVITLTDPLSAVAEGYRSVRAALLLTPTRQLGAGGGAVSSTGEPQVVLVTSAAPGDGKTTTVANLAATMAESGRTVLVLGCDFRRPEIHRYYEVAPAPGIADVLTGTATRRLEEIARPTTTAGVWVAPSGEGLRNLGDLAAGGRDLVTEARELADIVIIDTAPLLATNDAAELIPSCDAVVLVARIGKTTLDGAHRTRDLLERLGAPVTGVVAIGVPAADHAYAKYYTSTTAPEPRTTHRPTLRRTIRSAELEDRIGPWRGSSTVPSATPGIADLDSLDQPTGPAVPEAAEPAETAPDEAGSRAAGPAGDDGGPAAGQGRLAPSGELGPRHRAPGERSPQGPLRAVAPDEPGRP